MNVPGNAYFINTCTIPQQQQPTGYDEWTTHRQHARRSPQLAPPPLAPPLLALPLLAPPHSPPQALCRVAPFVESTHRSTIPLDARSCVLTIQLYNQK